MGSFARPLSWLLYACVAVQFFPVSNALASNGLPDQIAAYPGSFEVNDFGTTATGCESPNLQTSTCWCPGSTGSVQAFRVINDGRGSGSKVGAYVQQCSSGLPASASEYQGAYEIDDPAAGGQGCRSGNASTGQCSCPAGTNTILIRVLVDGSSGIIGSHVGICVAPASSPRYFGGAYQVDDAVSGGLGCRTSNPLTASCSCPPGFRAQSHRLLVDSSHGVIGSNLYTCAANVPAAQICPSQSADLTGANSANAAVQACINSTPAGGVLQLPAGTYRMDGPIQPSASMTIRTVGTAGSPSRCTSGIPCAVFLAAPTFNVDFGFVSVTQPSVTLDHIVMDGNRSNRVGSVAQQRCEGGNNHAGYNAIAHASAFSFIGSASVNALCGTSLELAGSNAVIDNSAFQGNGDHFTNNTWSDGFTALNSDGMRITNSYFAENSDVSLVIGGSKNAVVQNNTVYQNLNRAFAGMALDNFNDSQPNDFTGTVVSGNTVNCISCDFGMNLGPQAWYASSNLKGGTVTGNVVSGGIITLNMDGAGTSTNPMSVYGNILTHTPQSGNLCGVNSRFNAAPAPETVLAAGSTTPDTRSYTHGCH